MSQAPEGGGTTAIRRQVLVKASDGVIIATIRRIPVDMAGWQKMRYQGHWYQLFGGVRVPEYLRLGFSLREQAARRRQRQYPQE